MKSGVYKNNKKNIFIGGAWPYANNSLHLGHIAGLISGDVLARYYRQNGDDVIYISGTDCHGTPVTVTAKKRGVEPREIAEAYHKEFSNVFKEMYFSFDLYSKTEEIYHQESVKEFLKKINDNGYIYQKKDVQPFCQKCNKFLSDRELQISCPACNSITKGDICDCGYEPSEDDFKDALCLECGNKVMQKETTNLYFSLKKLQPEIEKYIRENKLNWRVCSQNESEKYLKAGLRDKAITRNLEWGIDVPILGFEDKKIYVWIEAVLGYISTCKQICKEYGWDWELFCKGNKENLIYMVHGKDNIIFHTILLPGLLLSLNEGYKLPDKMVATHYLNINSEKISKSKENGITIEQMLKTYDPDMIRYYLISSGPEKKDSNFLIEEFTSTCNAEVVNKYGNLVNRILRYKGLKKIPNGHMDDRMQKLIANAYSEISLLIEKLEFKCAISIIKGLIDEGNRYYEEQQPWKLEREDPEKFIDSIYTCCNLIGNLSNLLNPIMPKSSQKVREYLGIEFACWNPILVEGNKQLEEVVPLFTKII